MPCQRVDGWIVVLGHVPFHPSSIRIRSPIRFASMDDHLTKCPNAMPNIRNLTNMGRRCMQLTMAPLIVKGCCMPKDVPANKLIPVSSCSFDVVIGKVLLRQLHAATWDQVSHPNLAHPMWWPCQTKKQTIYLFNTTLWQETYSQASLKPT